MLMALPLDKLGLVSGIINTLKAILGDSQISTVVVTILGIGVLYSFLANMVTWTMGANRAAAEAAGEGEMPAAFGKLHPTNNTPTGAFIITGIVSSLVLVVYGLFASSSADLFWTLFAFSSIVFLLPYLVMFPAFLKLRFTDKDKVRPYKVPGGNGFATILTVICIIFILQAVVFFIWVPGSPVDWAFAAPVLLGVALTLMIGEFLLTTSSMEEEKINPWTNILAFVLPPVGAILFAADKAISAESRKKGIWMSLLWLVGLVIVVGLAWYLFSSGVISVAAPAA
jgi:amino acid transporter